MSDATDALESLESLALRSESQEAITPLVEAIAPFIAEGLEDPGIPIILTIKVDVDGNSSVRYLGDPDWAIAQIRAIADQVEKETIVG